MAHNPFAALLLITALAALVPLVASRFRMFQIPVVVGEIIAGMIIGHTGFNLIEPSPTLEFLAEFGFTYLMFLSGLEVDFSLLIGSSGDHGDGRLWQQPIVQALIVFLLTLLLGFVSATGLQRMGLIQDPLLMGLILSTTSLGIVVPVLKEKNILGTAYGQAILTAALIADFVTLLLLTMDIALISQGVTLDLLLIVVLLAAFAVAVRLGRYFAGIPLLRDVVRELSAATAQIQVRGAFALMVAWVVLAEALGVEVILGAFLAGAVVSLIAGHEESPLREKLDAIGYGFFIPIFFITVGINFNVKAAFSSTESLMLIPILLVLAFLVKLVPALVYRLRFSWRETIAAGFLLSSRLSLIIAAAAIALKIGVISEAVDMVIILVAIVTCTLAPMLFNRIYKMPASVQRHGIIIVGADQMAELLARRLQRQGEELIVVAKDRRRLNALARQGHKTIAGDPADPEVLRQAGAEHAAALVALTVSAPIRYQVCLRAKQDFAIPIVVARVGSVAMAKELRALGVRVVQPALATVIALEGALRFPTTFDLLTSADEDVTIGEAVVQNTALTGISLRRLRLPGNALILSIRREGAVVVPHGDTVLHPGDRVALIGSPESVKDAVELLGARHD